MTPPLSHRVSGLRLRAELSEFEREEMFTLLSCYFEGVTRAQFEEDLEEKNWVIEMRKEGQLVGFSTLLIEPNCDRGTPITVVYSGDTIVAPEARGSPALARAWIAAVNCVREEQPRRPCYWLLLTSGFRTYRFLPVFWREFYPRYDLPTPAGSQELLERLATERYGRNYFPNTGVVRFAYPQRLRGNLADIPAGRGQDPHVKFFLERNPGHGEGDELVCLTELSERNLTPAGRRMVVPAR